jgi:hypothetical protein
MVGLIKPGASLALVAAIGAAALSTRTPPEPAVAEVTAVAASHYRVIHAGRDTGCRIEVGEALADTRLPMVLGADCSKEAVLSGLNYWADRKDGTIELSDESGGVAIRLAASDGADYEAFGADAPLITLVDSGR